MPLEPSTELIKLILDHLHDPDELGQHPWANSLIVQAAVAANPALAQKEKGLQLAFAVSEIFRELLPGMPPKHGKRLDTRWGEIGILAAQYFAPFLFGVPKPDTLTEAWGKIDQAILLFVYNKPAQALTQEQVVLYKLVGDEPRIAPYSTISDWHLNGIKRLTQAILEREKFLQHHGVKSEEALPSAQSRNTQPNLSSKPGIPSTRILKWGFRLLAICLFLASLLAINKTLIIYQLARTVNTDLTQVQTLLSNNLELSKVKSAAALLTKLRLDVGNLHAQAAGPLRVLSIFLTWMPTYGPNIGAASDLLNLGDALAKSADLSFQAAAPLLEVSQSVSGPLSPQTFTKILVQQQPLFLQAQQSLSDALTIRAQIKAETLSPTLRDQIKKIDSALNLMQFSLTFAIVAPKILGASSEGPQTYLLLAQNEDELRPTGGYITSVGSFLVSNGEVLDLQFSDSSTFANWSRPYPTAPWQLQEYMNIPVMLLQDANWFSDYPTSAARIEYLYAYNSKHSVDGIFTIDQQALVAILQALGPVIVQSSATPITSANVIQFMRNSKLPPTLENRPADWYRKAFIGELSSAILEKLFSGENLNWQLLARALQRALDERHILLQFDDTNLAGLISTLNWDGAIRTGEGDFIMSVDTNVGYNKTDSVVEKKLTYDIDLTNPTNPTSTLIIFHENHARINSPCQAYLPTNALDADYSDGINRCYQNYLRLYVPDGARLTDATPHTIPAEWTLRNTAVPARIDTLDEKIAGAQSFGTLLVVPGGKSLNTSFSFSLPPEIVDTNPANGQKSYTLKIQKQPGTSATHVTVRIHIPTNTKILELSTGAIQQGNNIILESNLLTDIILKVVFSTQ